MERIFVKKLLDWKNSRTRMPLIVHGARQVGKTYSILSFAQKYYSSYIYLNFDDDVHLAQIFERNFDINRLLLEFSAHSGKHIVAGETLIIFDEVQACERALSSLKYFNEKAPEHHVIAAGSLLGVAINRQKYSFPVGKVDMATLYPLDFEEFLMALGQSSLIELIKYSYSSWSPLTLHQKALDFYRLYLAVGGMPRAVVDYIETSNFDTVKYILKNINDAYIADMAKYSSGIEAVKIKATYSSITAQLAKENKKFQYKYIKSGARANQYDFAIDWLNYSGVIIKCSKVTNAFLPLEAFVDASSFKIYYADIGLLTSKLNIPSTILLSDVSSLNYFKGVIAENYVISALAKTGKTLFYWESEGKAEIDFVTQMNNGDIIPIEVKSGDNTKSKSLSVFTAKYKSPYAIRFSSKNFGYENNIKSVPLYATFLV